MTGETPGSRFPVARGMFHDLGREHAMEPLRVEGRLPPELHGTLFRNGPARFAAPDGPYVHWFDGDGAVTAVRLKEGRASAASRFVRTRWLAEEESAGRRLYRNYAQLGRGWRRWGTLPKNTANIGVLPWGGEVLALWEAGRPIALDPDTLEARGETDLGGMLGPTFSAHPHRVGDTVYNFGVRYGATFALDLYAMADGVRRIATLPLPRPTLIHDFIATERHLVFFCAPIHLQLAPLLTGLRPFDQNLAWEPEHGTEVIVVPLADPTRPTRFTAPPFFQWHFVNAWDTPDGSLIVDSVRFVDFSTDAWFGRAPWRAPVAPPPSAYVRTRVDCRQCRLEDETLFDVPCEFPAIHPGAVARPTEHAWMLAFDGARAPGGWPPTLGRFDVATRQLRAVPLPEGAFPCEPTVFPRAQDEHGWVLSLLTDEAGGPASLVVIDGARPEDGPVARAWLDHHVPLTFHGAWAGS